MVSGVTYSEGYCSLNASTDGRHARLSQTAECLAEAGNIDDVDGRGSYTHALRFKFGHESFGHVCYSAGTRQDDEIASAVRGYPANKASAEPAEPTGYHVGRICAERML